MSTSSRRPFTKVIMLSSLFSLQVVMNERKLFNPLFVCIQIMRFKELNLPDFYEKPVLVALHACTILDFNI